MIKNKVLIVEDEGILSMDMANNLETMGYEVLAAVPSGEEAINLVESAQPDLILMDVQLSGKLDGIQAAEKINRKYNIPIIYISGHTDELTLSRAKITGPYGYIAKSSNYNELHTTIDMAIYKNEMQRKVVEHENLLNTSLENIEDAVINVDNEGIIQYLNSPAATLLNIMQKKAKFMKIDRIGIKWIKTDGSELVHPYINSKIKKIKKREYRLLNTASGKDIPVECSINSLNDSNRRIKGYVYLIQNIKERKKIDDIQSRLASIVESSQDAIIGIDTNGIIRTWNNGARKILGYSYDEVAGQNISMFTPDNFPNEMPEKIEKLKQSKAITHYESIRQKKNGEFIAMSILPSPIKDSDGKITGISFVARDVTEKKKLEKEVIEIGEKERERIGQDLHDSLGQQLTGVLLNMKTLENMLKDRISEEDLSQLFTTEVLIKTAIKQTRMMAKNLIAVKLQYEGLPHALEDLASFARNIYNKKVETRIDENINDINVITETQLYRIAQEAINNSVKHSGSEEISLTLTIAQNELVLSIKDDGVGISSSKSSGIGINIMKYRANLINGTLFIHSEKDEGTLVLCRVPLS